MVTKDSEEKEEKEGVIEKIRKMLGETHPDKASPTSLRGKYGKVHSIKNWHETVVHASDSKENAEREINLWFDKDELVE